VRRAQVTYATDRQTDTRYNMETLLVCTEARPVTRCPLACHTAPHGSAQVTCSTPCLSNLRDRQTDRQTHVTTLRHYSSTPSDQMSSSSTRISSDGLHVMYHANVTFKHPQSWPALNLASTAKLISSVASYCTKHRHHTITENV